MSHIEPRGLREIVNEFLDLLRVGRGDQEQNETDLGRLLDELALARHAVSPVWDDIDHPDPPSWPYRERMALARERFPGYGNYNVALDVTVNIGEGDRGVGDAIDDIADIAGDLHKVAWAWGNTSEADALWWFEFLFDSHFGQHLRELQLYLHHLEGEQ